MCKPCRPIATKKCILVSVPRQEDNLYSLRLRSSIHEALEQHAAFRPMVVSFCRRRAHSDDDIRVVEPKFSQETWIRHKLPNVNIFFDPRILPNMAVLQTKGFIRNHIGSHNPGWPHHSRKLRMLVICDQKSGNTKQIAEQDL